MNANAELLQYITQNTEMGKSSIQQLLDTIDHAEFRKVIESQYREYDEIYALASNALEERHKEAKGVNPMAKISSYIMINVNAMADGSVSSMAEMIDVYKRQGHLSWGGRHPIRAGRGPGRPHPARAGDPPARRSHG